MTDNDWDDDANPWTITGMTQPFANDWFRIDAHDVIHPNGQPGTYGVIRIRRLAVGVLPIEPDGRVHLVGQWRFPLGRYSWEMPEGGAEPGEPALACAKRELAEETGFTAGKLEPILEMDMSNSLTDEMAVIFLATDLRPGAARPEPTEVLKRRSAPFADVLERVADGRLRDSMTVAAVLRAHHMAITGRIAPGLARAMLGR
ncbi:NUDIX domain-containing protein [Terricaulis sp.]|uniref:NUDIX domain-containing protein n=1 Tax=Terricaulis sp. TaxID=2768686 RepID=UPI0037830725